MKYAFSAAGVTAAGLMGLGIFAAAPATAQPTFTGQDCPESPFCYVGPPNTFGVVPNTIINYSRAPLITARNYANLPLNTVNGYANAIHDTIRNYTGISVGTDPNPDN